MRDVFAPVGSEMFVESEGQIMKKLLVLSAALLFLVQASSAQKVQWKELISDELHFAIQFPGDPISEKSEMPGEGLYRYEFSFGEREQIFSVRVSELQKTSSGPLNETALGVFYSIARRGAIDWLKGSELVGETDIKLDGQLGRQFSIRNEHTFLIRRVFMLDDKLYQVTVLMPKRREKDSKAVEAVTKFFNSFRLTRPKK